MANDEPPARQPGYRPPDNRPTPAPEGAQPSASRLSVDVAPRYIRLQPGEVVTATIKVRNMGSVVDEITLTPRGEAAAWITVAPDTLNIYPSTEGEATIRFAPARAPRPPAGLFAFEIAVNSDRQPASSMVYRGSVELGAYDSLTAAATGTTFLSGRRDAILPIKVRNQGNRPTNVQVSAADLPGANVILSAPAFALEPGGEATVWATIRPRSGFMSGPPRQFPFTISVSSDYSAPLTIDGRMEQQARFSRKRLVAVGVLAAVLLTVGGVFGANALGLLPPLTGSGPTPTPAVTASAAITPPPSGQSTTGPTTGPTDKPTGGPTASVEVTNGPTPTITPSPTPTTDPFAHWQNLGGDFSKGAAAVSWGPRTVQVFAPDSNGTLVTKEGDGAAFPDQWTPLDSSITTQEKPAAVAWNDAGSSGKNVNVFVLGDQDGQLHEISYDQSDGVGSWFGWSDLPFSGFGFQSGPGAASRGINRIDVFGRTSDNGLQYSSLEQGVGFADWQLPPDPGSVRYAPTAVAGDAQLTGVDRVDVFATFTDFHVHQLTNQASSWGNWQLLPGGPDFNSGPAVTSWGPNQFDVFARAKDSGHLWHTSFDGTTWTAWDEMTQFKLAEAPAAASWGNGRIDLFVVDTNGEMHHSWYENNQWQP